MHHEFNPERNAHLVREPDGTVSQVMHGHAPVRIDAPSARAAAAEYLRRHGDILAVDPANADTLDTPPAGSIERRGVEFRFLDEKRQFDMVTVNYYQTALGLPIWEAGLGVHVQLDPLRIVAVQSTAHGDVDVQPPPKQALAAIERLDEKQLARLLGLEDEPDEHRAWKRSSLKVEARSLMVYRFEAAQRQFDPGVGLHPHGEDRGERHGEGGHTHRGLPALPLPPLPDEFCDRQHYVCLKVDFALDSAQAGSLHWCALVSAQPQAVLHVFPFVAGVKGQVFEIDPITTNGSPAPSGTSVQLNPVRVSDNLPGLAPPSGGTQSLAGDNVALVDVEAPTIAAPSEPAGTDFNFDARTDNFAAINAYYHCDKFFRLADGMGFTRAGYFGGTSFPSTVDHRGSMNTATGIEINAHCVGTSGGGGIQQTTFALADLGDLVNPLGIACDYRVVLHELGGHGVLYNHVSRANFGFSHSAGDSVAAILSDPGSQAADRFVTFPWVNIGRRHDRTPAAGWGYAGKIALSPFNAALDSGGYNNEQILSTTHFRVYRSIGGDAANLAKQQFSARICTYLILRGIGTLTKATNPANATGWVTALLAADQGNWTTEGVTGGCYGKVIRWSFEKQGLFQAPGTATPNNNEGVPPDVDVYIDDGRAGEYTYQPNWWSTATIWNRLEPDGQPGHQDPAGTVNYAYVKVKNRGTKLASNVAVRGFHCKPAAGVLWPVDLQPMTTAQIAVGTLQPNNAEEKLVGPFAWTPATNAAGVDTMLMIVSAAGDASNADSFTPGLTVEDWRFVPNDNNVARRNVVLVRLAIFIADAGYFGQVCPGSFVDEMLCLNNCGFNAVSVSHITSSSPDFVVPGVFAYPLTIAPGVSLQVPIRFQPGSSGFKSATLTVFSNDPAGPRTLQVSGQAGSPRLVVVVPDAGDFGACCVGHFVEHDIVLNNGGHCTLHVRSITSSSPEFQVPSVNAYPIAVEPGGSIEIALRLHPSSFGAKSATITIDSDDPSGARTVAVHGTAPSGALTVTGSTYFGGVTAGCCADRVLSLCNTGDCALHVRAVHFARPSRHWRLLHNPFPVTLHPGSCIGLTIQYKATEKCGRVAELVIETDDPKDPVKTLELMAYTEWCQCGGAGCGGDCKGGCGKQSGAGCCQQGYPCCCDDDEEPGTL